MAKSAASKLFQGSAAPALKNTTNFIDAAITNPEVLMRNPEERLLYHTRANQELADAGLIQRENLLPKAYVDARQANNIVQGDLYDAYARSDTRLDPSLQEQVTLINAGLPKDFVQGSTKGATREVTEGNYKNKYTDYMTQNPIETTVTDPGTGEPVKRFSVGSTPSTVLESSKPTDEYKAKLKRGAKEKRSAVIKRGNMITDEELLAIDYNLLDSQLSLSGYSDDERRLINNVVEKAAMENSDVDSAIAEIQTSVRNLDDRAKQGIIETMANYNARFKDHVVLDDKGKASMQRVRLDAENQVESFVMYGDGSGEGNTLNFPRYVGGGNKRLLSVPTNQGDVLMSADYINNKLEAMKRNYAKSRKDDEQIVFNLDPETLVVLDDIAIDPKGGGVIDYNTKDDALVSGVWLDRHKTLNNSDPDYTAAYRKDLKGTNTLLQNSGLLDDGGEFDEGSPEAIRIQKKLNSGFYSDENSNTSPDKEWNSKTEEEQQALIKFEYLNGKYPGMVHMYPLRDGNYEVGLNTTSADYLAQQDRGGGNRGSMLTDAANVVQDKPIQLVTPQGEAIPIEYGAGLEGGQVKLFANGPNGELIKVSGKRNSDKYTVQKQVSELSDKLINAYSEAGLVDPNTKAGIGKKANLVPVGGYPRAK